MNITWPILTGAALADSLNPITFALLILLYQFHQQDKVKKSSTNDHLGAFICGVFLTNLIIGHTFPFILSLTNTLTPIVIPILGTISIVAGLHQTKTYFIKPKSPPVPKRLTTYARAFSHSLLVSASLGAIVTLVELPISGLTYISTLTIATLTSFPGPANLSLLLYNTIYITPLILIALHLSYDLKTKRFELLGKEHKNSLTLGAGLLLISLGIWLLTL